MADADGQPQRKRARQACLACNARRVKCNVTEKQPCDNCVAGNVACETRESRRGKHPRPSKKRHSIDSSITAATPSRSQTQHTDELAGAHVLASLHRNRPSDGFDNDMSDIGNFMKTEQAISPHRDVCIPTHLVFNYNCRPTWAYLPPTEGSRICLVILNCD